MSWSSPNMTVDNIFLFYSPSLNISLLTSNLCHYKKPPAQYIPLPCRERVAAEPSGEGYPDAQAPAFIFIFFSLLFPVSFRLLFFLPYSFLYAILSLNWLDKISQTPQMPPFSLENPHFTITSKTACNLGAKVVF